MPRAKPRLTPEWRAHLSEEMKRRHADPDFRMTLGKAASAAYRKRARKPEYRAWRSELAFEARLDPKRCINHRAAMRRRWAKPGAREAQRQSLRRRKADPEFQRLTNEARWTPAARAKESARKRRLWAERRAFVHELISRGLLLRKQRRPGKIAGIILKVMKAHRITLDDLLRKTRRALIVEARMEASRLLRAAGFSYPVIARALSLHHTTVIHAVQKGEARS